MFFSHRALGNEVVVSGGVIQCRFVPQSIYSVCCVLGIPGLKGIQGPQGIQGPAGDMGFHGEKGDVGPSGPRGMSSLYKARHWARPSVKVNIPKIVTT